MFEPVNFGNLSGSAGAGGGYVPVRKKIVIPQKQQQPQQFFVGSQSAEVTSQESAKAQSNAAKVRFTGNFKSYIARLNTQAAINTYSNL